MRILGIDPGLARVGYGVIDIQDGCQRMLDCGIIQTDSDRSDGDLSLIHISEPTRP